MHSTETVRGDGPRRARRGRDERTSYRPTTACCVPLMIALLVASQVTGCGEHHETALVTAPTATPSATPAVDLGIRLDRELHVGTDVHLEATGVEGVDPEDATFEWQLLSRPPTSQATLSSRTGAETSLRSDVPGRYVVTVDFRVAGVLRDSATLEATASDPGPLIAVDTITLNPDATQFANSSCTPGTAVAITIGSQCYPHPNGGQGFQVLVVDRSDLSLVSNKSYAVSSSALATLKSDLQKLPSPADTNLVFVTLPSAALAATGGILPSSLVGDVDDALGEIGGVVPKAWILPENGADPCWSGNVAACPKDWVQAAYDVTSFTVVGVAGMSAGNAWFDSAAQRGNPRGDGRIIGYLTPGTEVNSVANVNAKTLVFQADQYVLADTCAGEGCVIQVGTQTFAPEPGVNGVHVVVLDRVTLAPITHQTVTSTSALSAVLAAATGGRDAAVHTAMGPDASKITDGAFGTSSSPWNSAYAVVLGAAGVDAALTIDLGSVVTLCGSGSCVPRVQADRHPFQVDYSTDGIHWTSFGKVPDESGSGQITRNVVPDQPANFAARYVRLYGLPADDDNYAIAEVQLRDSNGQLVSFGKPAIGPRPYKISDGRFAPEGTSWNDTDWAVVLRGAGPANALVIDLETPIWIDGATTDIQADKNTYQVDYSLDGTHWTPYATLPALSGVTGLQTRNLAALDLGASLANFYARYLRVWGLAGDGNYSVSEVRVVPVTGFAQFGYPTYGPEAAPTNGEVAPEGADFNDPRYAIVLEPCASSSLCTPGSRSPLSGAFGVDLGNAVPISSLTVQADRHEFQVDYLASDGSWKPLWTVPAVSDSGLRTRESGVLATRPSARYLIVYATATTPDDTNYTLSSVQVFTAGGPGHFQPSLSSDQTVVLLQTVGTRFLTNDCSPALLQQIDQLGGTPETFAPAIQQGQPYGLIGVAGKLPWHGTSSEWRPAKASMQGVGVRGVLARDRMARYAPAVSDPTSQNMILDILPIAHQDPTPWPYANSQWIGYIANQIGVGKTYPDIRSGYNDTSILWTNKTIAPCPSPPPAGYPSCDEYDAVKAQLENEFVWVEEVRTFVTNMKAPFETSASGDSVLVQTIANTLLSDLAVPKTASTSLNWLDVFKRTLSLVTLMTAGPETSAMGLIATTGKFTSFLSLMSSGSSSGAGSLADQIQTEAQDLAQQLQYEVNAHLAALGTLGWVIVADAGKLTTVGTNLASGAWPWSDQAATTAVTLLNATTESAVYASLMPLTGWSLYNLKPDKVTVFNSGDVNQFECAGNDVSACHAFAHTVEGNRFSSQAPLCATVTETSASEVWTFAYLYPSSEAQDFWDDPCHNRDFPPDDFTTDLFSTDSGGAAAYPPDWYRETYNPPKAITCSLNAPPVVAAICSDTVGCTIGPTEAQYTDG
jgi:hypothetical protein